MKTISTALLLTFATSFLFAQNYQLISGQLLDAESGKSIPYANIGIPEKGIGTTSNMDGRFTFKVPNFYRNSTLIVSVIGYETFKSPLADFDQYTIIDLKPTSYQLSEIQIVDENAVEDIIRKAVARIPNNYPTHATTNLGFYRESRTDADDNYVYLAEGVLNIHQKSYKNTKDGIVGLVQGRKMNLKNPLDTTIRAGFSSGHMAAHRFDFVKNREDFINEAYFPAYKYWIESITTYNGREVYVIGFGKDPDVTELPRGKTKRKSLLSRIVRGPKSNVLDARLKGKVYIEKETYAFLRAEFEVTKKGLRKSNDYPLYSGTWTFNKYVVNYQKVGDKWYFSYELREGGRKSGGVYYNEIKITQVNTNKAGPPPYLERIHREQEFVDMTGVYDEDFWKSYNTVQMSEKLSESIQQFKNASKAEQVFAIDKMQEIQQLRDSITLAERIAKAQEEAEENNDFFDPAEITFGEPGVVAERKRKYRLETMLGVGTQLISTAATPLQISYLDDDADAVLLGVNETVDPRSFEAIYATDFSIVMNDRWFLRFGGARDFGRTIFRESSSGLGVQFNLSRGRPVFLKLLAQHSSKRYARLVGIAENIDSPILVDGKRFNSNEVRIFYGSRNRALKLSGELTVELRGSREVYFRGAYYLPYSQRQEVHFREKQFFFKRRAKLPVELDRLRVTSADVPFTESIFNSGELQFTVGYVFK